MSGRLAVSPEAFEALARECIASDPSHHARNLGWAMVNLARNRNLYPRTRDDFVVQVNRGQEDLSSEDFVILMDLLWKWVREGHIRPGQSLPSFHDTSSFGFPHFHVTASGEEFFQS